MKVSAPTGRFVDLDPEKLRGGYYTSSELAVWISDWAIRSPDDHVLEPSCGDGQFIVAVANRLSELGASPEAIEKQLVGVEVLKDEAHKASDRLRATLGVRRTSSIENHDFFEWWQRPGHDRFDSVVGNPPFIRYQSFPEPSRSLAMALMQRLGLKPNKLTNIWVPFVAAAVEALRPDGRLALVLPAELLQVSYAAQLRSYLLSHFARLHIVACNELIFDKAQQEVVVLFAEGAHTLKRNGVSGVSVSQLLDRRSLLGKDPQDLLAQTEEKLVHHESEKWLKYFLSQKQIDLLRHLRESGIAASLNKYADVDVGVVTGKNEFFVVSDAEVIEWDLSEYVLPLVGRSAHLAGATFSVEDWERLRRSDRRVNLLQLGQADRASLPTQTLAYIDAGERSHFHLGYKCSIRNPWYAVPSVWIPDSFLFRQIHDFPRIVVNTAGATCTDTIHRMRVHSADAAELASMCFTSLTAASAEIEGRSYGGGVLELEPREAERLLVPASITKGLHLDEIDRLVRAGRLLEVLDINDRLILGDSLGISAPERKLLRQAWSTMRERRHSRRKAKKAAQI